MEFRQETDVAGLHRTKALRNETGARIPAREYGRRKMYTGLCSGRREHRVLKYPVPAARPGA